MEAKRESKSLSRRISSQLLEEILDETLDRTQEIEIIEDDDFETISDNSNILLKGF